MAAWSLNVEGLVVHDGDLTLDEAERMENATNTTWRFINPLRSAGHARAILQTLLVTRKGVSEDEAKARVGAMKVNDFIDLLKEEEPDADLPTQFEDGFPPKADEGSTPT